MYKNLNFLVLLILSNLIYGTRCTDQVDGVEWCFDISMQQAFYIYTDIEIDGLDIEQGSVIGPNTGVWECPEGDCDIIAAFFNDVCVGWTYPYYGNGYTVPVMMNDGNLSDYPSLDEIPEFRLYDNSSSSIYSTFSNPEVPGVSNFAFNLMDLLSNTELNSDNANLPLSFNISDIYPNPFNASTTISYSVPTLLNINISIFNILGQEIITLLDSNQIPGFYNIVWNAEDIPSGFYLVRLNTETESISQKVLLVK